MEIANLFTEFPPELLQAVFDKLSHTDLKSIVLVCRPFRRAGEYKKLWSWVTLEANEDNLALMVQVLATARLQSMKELHVRAVSEELLEAIKKHPGLGVLNLSLCDVSSAEPKLLAMVISKMENVTLIQTELTAEQKRELFDTLSSESELKKLFMPDCDFTSVDPETLAKVISNLEWVNINGSVMTLLQCNTIFNCASNKTNLVKIAMSGIDLSTVNHESLASVVSKLKEVVLVNTNLTSQQCKQIFKVAVTTTKLTTVDLSPNNFSSVDPLDLSVVVAKLKKVNLNGTSLTLRQCEAIFEAAASDSCQLEVLRIKWNDLSSVNEQILAKAVSKLEEVDLSVAHLTRNQWKEIFMYLNGDSKLEKLTMYGCHNLSEVSPEIMASVISKLKLLDMGHVGINSQKWKTIFENLSSDCKLKDLNIASNDLNEVNPEDLARIIPNLGEANLMFTKLSTRQCEAIFQAVTSESKIKKLEISNNNLSSINPELLARAMIELEEIDVDDSELTAQQCQVIFQWLTQDSKKLKKLDMFGNDLELVDPDSIARVSSKLELIIRD